MNIQLYILDGKVLSYTADKELKFLLYVLDDVKIKEFKLRDNFLFTVKERPRPQILPSVYL
jgi:hypothetical protein